MAAAPVYRRQAASSSPEVARSPEENRLASLMERGDAAADMEKILGGNILRVMEQVEAGAARAQH